MHKVQNINTITSPTPLPPFGHLLPMSGEKGIMKEIILEKP